jgi:hypothetical protein
MWIKSRSTWVSLAQRCKESSQYHGYGSKLPIVRLLSLASQEQKDSRYSKPNRIYGIEGVCHTDYQIDKWNSGHECWETEDG